HCTFRTTRSGNAFSAYYEVNDPEFNLKNLYANALASQQQDEPEIVGADRATGKAARTRATPTDSSPLTPAPSSRSRSPPSPSSSRAPKRTRVSVKVKADRKKRKSRPAYPPPPPTIRPLDDFSAYQPSVGGAAQAKKRRSRIARAKKFQKTAGRTDGWAAAQTLRRVNARHLQQADQEPVDLDWEDMPVTSTAFTAKRGEGEEKVFTREELLKDPRFRYVAWPGKSSAGVVAPDGRVFGACVGKPDDPEYDAAIQTFTDELAVAGEHITFPAAAREHRRGHFGAQAEGVSHGGGQTEPANLKHTMALQAVMSYLIALPAMIRIAHFASSTFARWAPRLYAYYATTMHKLFNFDPSLKRNFPRSIWACLTINFGPRTVTYKHRDFGNLPFGWCAITALGNFNPDLGGDLVLWECGLIIRFPPGSTILIPSAIIHHSNTAIGPGETRYSVTQYTSGALFRWVEHGCMLDEQYYASLTVEEHATARQANLERWAKGLSMWSTWEELQKSARDVL
ncbi:hypothetical protein EV715DRAFT_214868, partial [Schizophyllum commune]